MSRPRGFPGVGVVVVAGCLAAGCALPKRDNLEDPAVKPNAAFTISASCTNR